MRQTHVGFWPSKVNSDCITFSRCLLSKVYQGIVRSALKKKDIIIHSSVTHISWIDLALGIISLKQKTSKLKPDTFLQRRVSCSIERNFTQSIHSKMAEFKKNQAKKQGLETPLNCDVMSHSKKETYNNSGLKRDLGFFFFCITNPTSRKLRMPNVTILENFDLRTCSVTLIIACRRSLRSVGWLQGLASPCARMWALVATITVVCRADLCGSLPWTDDCFCHHIGSLLAQLSFVDHCFGCLFCQFSAQPFPPLIGSGSW